LPLNGEMSSQSVSIPLTFGCLHHGKTWQGGDIWFLVICPYRFLQCPLFSLPGVFLEGVLVCCGCCNKMPLLLLTALEVAMSKIKTPAGLMSGAGPFPKHSTLWLFITWQRGQTASLRPLYEDTNAITRTPPSWFHDIPKTTSVNSITWGGQTWTSEFGRAGHKHSDHSMMASHCPGSHGRLLKGFSHFFHTLISITQGKCGVFVLWLP
jgi:hypothetical protein